MANPKTIPTRLPAVMALVFLCCGFAMPGASGQGGMTPQQRAESGHRLIHHGLAMATEAADLVMISQLGMAPNLDEATMKHGRDGLVQGRELIENATVIATELDGRVNSAMLAFSIELAEASMSYVSLIESMPAPGPEAERMAVHQMHMLINHAVRMAADGANLNMIGRQSRDTDVAELGGLHGTAMLDKALLMIDQVLTGPSMQRAHQAGLTRTTMQTTHQMARSARELVSLMSRMPVVGR